MDRTRCVEINEAARCVGFSEDETSQMYLHVRVGLSLLPVSLLFTITSCLRITL